MEQKDQELSDSHFDLEWDNEKFNLVYCGSIRQANQVQQICDAAKELLEKGCKNIEFQIYGNGTQLEFLKKYIIEKNITNVHFYGRIQKEKIPYILSHADANILTYKQVDLMKYGGSQSKLFDYLASGKPIISNAKWGYDLLERHCCGIVAENQSVSSLTDAIEKLFKLDREERIMMGKRARETAEMYDQPLLVDKLHEVFDYVMK